MLNIRLHNQRRFNLVLSPLIPDIKHPKWIIAIKILETIASPRAKRIASRLKIYDIDNLLLSIKLLVLSDLFERDVSGLIYEIDSNLQLKSLLKVNSKINSNLFINYTPNWITP